eukprot:2329411-Amphidinium_carterae.1
MLPKFGVLIQLERLLWSEGRRQEKFTECSSSNIFSRVPNLHTESWSESFQFYVLWSRNTLLPIRSSIPLGAVG